MIIYDKAKQFEIVKGLTTQEFRCRCEYAECSSIPIDPYFIKAFSNFRQLVDAPLTVTSGYRCPRHNFDVEGSPTSYHQFGQAIDISYSNKLELTFTPDEVENLAFAGGFRKIIFYPERRFFHLDIRGEHGR